MRTREYYGTERMRITEWNRAENRAGIAQAIPLRSPRQFDPVLYLFPLTLLALPARPSRLLDFHASRKCEFYERRINGFR